jgi:hypothetical protein
VEQQDFDDQVAGVFIGYAASYRNICNQPVSEFELVLRQKLAQVRRYRLMIFASGINCRKARINPLDSGTLIMFRSGSRGPVEHGSR